MHTRRRLLQLLLSASFATLAAITVITVISATSARAEDDTPAAPGPAITSTVQITATGAISLADPFGGLLTPAVAPPPIEYATSFAEIECPFVVPWNQEIICGELEVPENRTDPESQGVSLFVAILKSLGRPEADPVLVLPDGPGEDGVHLRGLFYDAPLRRNRDVILVDPQCGVGYSSPSLNCPEVDGAAPRSAELVAGYRACYERLVDEGHDLRGYSSAAQVEDIVDLAQVLGIGTLNLYATGYGTRIATLLADRHPNLVRSMVLDGVLPVAENVLLEEPLNLYNTVQRVAQDCTAAPACNAAFPALEARLLEVIDRYDAEPAAAGYGSGAEILALVVQRLAHGGDVLPAFITALFDEDFAAACALLPPAGGCKLPTSAAAAIESAQAARAEARQEPGAAWRARLPDAEDPFGANVETVSWLMGTLGFKTPDELFARLDALPPDEALALLVEAPETDLDSLGEGMAATLLCSEDAPLSTAADLRKVAARIPIQFGALPVEHAALVKAVCAFWTTTPLALSERVIQPILAPVLLVNGTHDAQTPPTWARRAAAGMDKSRVSLFPGLGHSILASGDECLPDMMQLFYENPGSEERAACEGGLTLEFALPAEESLP